MYGETPDMSGGFGQEGVDAFEKFLEAGGTLITTLGAVRFPIEFGFARSVDTEAVAGLNAQKPLVQAEIVKTDHPVFYGYAEKIIPVKYGQGQQVFRYGIADQDKVLGRFVGGDASVLSGLGEGAEALRNRAFAMDIPEAFRGKGRVDETAHVGGPRIRRRGVGRHRRGRVLHGRHVRNHLVLAAEPSQRACSGTPLEQGRRGGVVSIFSHELGEHAHELLQVLVRGARRLGE
jgi:hypothetical protein